jgi:small subunit ribosomal protein S21
MRRERSIDIDTSHLDKVKPLGVDVGDFKSFEAAVKKFRKIVEKEGIIRQVLDRKYYKKPSKKRHDKRRQILRRRELQKEEEKRQDLARRRRLRRKY